MTQVRYRSPESDAGHLSCSHEVCSPYHWRDVHE